MLHKIHNIGLFSKKRLRLIVNNMFLGRSVLEAKSLKMHVIMKNSINKIVLACQILKFKMKKIVA